MTENSCNPPDYRRNNLNENFFCIKVDRENEPEIKAERIINKLTEIFWDGSTLGHSYYNGTLQKRGEPETDCYNKICRML